MKQQHGNVVAILGLLMLHICVTYVEARLLAVKTKPATEGLQDIATHAQNVAALERILRLSHDGGDSGGANSDGNGGDPSNYYHPRGD